MFNIQKLPWFAIVLIAAALSGTTRSSFSQVPQIIGFQGLLTDNQGNPLPDGSYTLKVSLYDVDQGGTALWTEQHTAVRLTGGVLSINLGEETALNLPFDTRYWLGVTVGSDPELEPRLALTSVPYSINTRAILSEPPPGSSVTVRNVNGDTVHLLNADGAALHTGLITAEGGVQIPGGLGKTDGSSLIPVTGVLSTGTEIGVRGVSDDGVGVQGESMNGVAGQFIGNIEVLDSGTVLLDNVPLAAAGDLTPPAGTTDENARVLVWSQSDEIVRYISLNTNGGNQGDSDWVEDIVGDQVWTGRRIILKSGGDVFEVDNTNGTKPRVHAVSQNSNAFDGESQGGEGVHGESTGDDGIHGLALGDKDGVHGEATGNGRGVFGEALGDGEGVKGESSGTGAAVEGEASGNGPGIHGSSTGGKAGVFQGDLDVLKSPGGGTGKIKLEDIETSQQANPTNFLLRDGDGIVREATVPAGAGGGGDTDWFDDVPNNQVFTSDKSIRLQTGAGVYPFDVQNRANPPLRLLARTDNDAILGVSSADGVGVRGESVGGEGVTGTSTGGDGVKGTSTGAYGVTGITQAANKAAVYGMKGPATGVLGESVAKHGVHGITDAVVPTSVSVPVSWAGVQGEAVSAPGVRGLSTNNEGVYAKSRNYHGIVALSASEDDKKAAVYADGSENSMGVAAKSITSDGVNGFSRDKNGVFGKTDGTLQSTILIAGVRGVGDRTYGVHGRSLDENGVFGISQKKSGIYGTSTDLHGVEGFVTMGISPDIAGVKGESGGGQSGVYGVSNSGPGVRGTSESGFAGVFDGQVHITDAGTKKSKLKIDMMEDDPIAPCLVWSGDKYVRKRKCWTLDDEIVDGDTTTYQASAFGIRVKGGEQGQDVVFEVNTDGTSLHTGLEKFAGGLQVVDAQKKDSVLIDMTAGEMMVNQRLSVKNAAGVRIVDMNPNDPYSLKVTGATHLGIGTGGIVQIDGILTVNGPIAATGPVTAPNVKPFTIDHPLDPDNMYLRHFSIESPEVLNMYTGNAILDKEGTAWVKLPAYFEMINREYRYQLTSIGSPGPNLYIAREIEQNRFQIAGGQPGAKVSWEVTTLRDDPAMKWYALQTEQIKPDDKKGTYLLPEYYGDEKDDH